MIQYDDDTGRISTAFEIRSSSSSYFSNEKEIYLKYNFLENSVAYRSKLYNIYFIIVKKIIHIELLFLLFKFSLSSEDFYISTYVDIKYNNCSR